MSGQPAGLPANSVGLGLRSNHIEHVLREQPDVAWFEVLMDNHTAKGGLIPVQLAAVREHYPLTLHCVGMSLAGVEPLDMHYLSTVRRMMHDYCPEQISDHLCFTNHASHHFNDLLPIPYTRESLNHVSDRIDQVQDYLDTNILVENVSTYLQFERSEMNEAEFMAELVKRSGCGILLDINNAYVNEFNHGYSAKEFIDTIPIEHVGEVHLAGYEDKTDYLIDAHNNRVSGPVWDLFQYYLQYRHTAPVLIEWDNDIPALDVLLSEAARATEIILHNTANTSRCASC